MCEEVISAGILTIPFSFKVLKSRLKKKQSMSYLDFGGISSLDDPVLRYVVIQRITPQSFCFTVMTHFGKIVMCIWLLDYCRSQWVHYI